MTYLVLFSDCDIASGMYIEIYIIVSGSVAKHSEFKHLIKQHKFQSQLGGHIELILKQFLKQQNILYSFLSPNMGCEAVFLGRYFHV